jgi:hypothetical protein
VSYRHPGANYRVLPHSGLIHQIRNLDAQLLSVHTFEAKFPNLRFERIDPWYMNIHDQITTFLHTKQVMWDLLNDENDVFEGAILPFVAHTNTFDLGTLDASGRNRDMDGYLFRLFGLKIASDALCAVGTMEELMKREFEGIFQFN